MPIILTPAQQRYFGNLAENQNEDMAICSYDEASRSIFVERKATLDEDGSGVWVDASGQEVHGS